jgi:peptidoglycan/LPS O-acetylase OafA/YrhL
MADESPHRLGRRRALDGLRGVAVLLVVLGHTIGVAGYGHRASALGVTLFFVLSGFLITTLLVEEHHNSSRISLRNFYWRRSLRLLPALALVLAFVTGVLAFGSLMHQWWGSVGATLFYVANITKAAGVPFAPMGHAWSLAMEEQFYLVWPLLLVALLRYRVRLLHVVTALLATSLVVSGWRWFTWVTTGDEMRTAWAPDMRADALIVGCALGILFWLGRLKTSSRLTAGAWIAAGSLALLVHGDWLWVWGISLMTTLSAMILIGTVSHGARWLEWTPMVKVGRVSYGLYLWHYVLMSIFAAGEGMERLISVLLTLPVAFLMTALSYRCIEQPALRFKHWKPTLAGKTAPNFMAQSARTTANLPNFHAPAGVSSGAAVGARKHS